jgi:hypothetical protein
MKNTISKLMLVSAITLSTGACNMMHREAALNSPPGTYESKTSSTDANGTTTERKATTDVRVDEYGNKKAVVETKTTTDPKGLFNKKTTSETKEVIKESDY